MKKRAKRGWVAYVLGDLLPNAEIVYRYNRVESTKERRWSNMERIVWINIRKKVPTPQRQAHRQNRNLGI